MSYLFSAIYSVFFSEIHPKSTIVIQVVGLAICLCDAHVCIGQQLNELRLS
jgi:hypothetical protein